MESMEGGEESESENITFNENEKSTMALNTQRGSNNNREPTTALHMQNIKNAPSSSLPGIEEEEVDRR